MQEVNWDKISKNPNLTLSFIKKNEDRLNWDILWEGQLVDILVQNFPERVNWLTISMHPCLSVSILHKYADKIDWVIVTRAHALTDDFLIEFADFLDWAWIIRYHDIPESLLNSAYNDISKRACILNWKEITKKRTLTPMFVKTFEEWLDWTYIKKMQI